MWLGVYFAYTHSILNHLYKPCLVGICQIYIYYLLVFRGLCEYTPRHYMPQVIST